MSIGEFLANWRPAPLAIFDLGFLQQSSVYGMVAHYCRVESPCSPKKQLSGVLLPPGRVQGACFALSLMPIGELRAN
jgi:hypothetical protein